MKAYIPYHFAYTKGLVRGINSSADATKILDQFKDCGTVEVYRCSVVGDGQRVSTESCMSPLLASSVHPKLECDH